ncbi:outer membrane lipoprotein chaperone LolA [Eionea flava]
MSFKQLTLFIFLLLLGFKVYADDAGELTSKLALLTTFSGEFQQTLVDDEEQVLQASKGIFSLKRPGYFYWETTAPFPQLLVSDLNTIWLYDPDLEQVSVKPYDEKISQTPALLLSGDVNKVSDAYRVEKLNVDAQTNSEVFSDNPVTVFALFPKQPQTLFTQLLVEFTGDQLASMQLHDSLGQVTTFAFSQGVYNQAIANEQFTFTPPDGVDVIQAQ